jgi:hypothetical protein
VYGPRKAGTTLLQNLLDGGSAMLMVPGELKLKVFVRKQERARVDAAGLFVARGRSILPISFQPGPEAPQTADDMSDKGGLSIRKFSEILDVEKYAAQISEIQSDPAMDIGEVLKADITAFVAALREGPAAEKRWASKEVGGDPLRILELFRRHFPQGQVVFAVRQPEFIVRSILLDRKRKGKRIGIRGILHECQDAQRIIAYGYERALREDVVVAYEQLTADVHAEILRVCGLLGIPFEEILTTPTTLGQPVVVDTSSQQTKQVFRQPIRWQQNLTWRQVMVIGGFQIFAPFWYFMKGRPFVRYDQVISTLNLIKSRAASTVL